MRWTASWIARGSSTASLASAATACRAEFLVAFRCHGRYFCPSCHARRLAEWSLWLDGHLLARVPHRQVVLTLPKRLRPWFIHHDRRRRGDLSRLVFRTLRDYLRAATHERDLAPGAIVCLQTFRAPSPTPTPTCTCSSL